MKTMNFMKKGIFVMALAIACCATASAHRKHRPHAIPPRPTAAIVIRPAVTVHVQHRLTRKGRLDMAISYLKQNKYLNAKKYARMTGLPRQKAKAELEAFAHDPRKPIIQVWKGKNKVSTLRR